MKLLNRTKISVLTLVLISTFLTLTPISRVNAIEKPSRIINVVYDDSNSMLEDGKQTWSYARYALQVFAALLEDKDVLNIYFMSDHNDPKNNKPTYTIKGSEVAIERVRKVYEMAPTNTGGTPFQPVKNAYNDLPYKEDQSTQIWLVILNDGAFDGGVDINKELSTYINEKPSLMIANLAIGDIEKSLPNESDHIFVYPAARQEDVTSKIAELGQRIFNRNKIDAIQKDGKYQINLENVPMEELIVFAQGTNIDIKSIGNLNLNRTAVKVQMTSADNIKATTDKDRSITSAVLNGVVASFKPKNETYIEPGIYDLNIGGTVSGPVQVFYKPKVKIQVQLLNENNEAVEEGNIVSGDYKLDYKIVDLNNNEIGNSELIGKLVYSQVVTNNGNTVDEVNGKISVVSGDLEVEVTARYLDYNTLTDEMRFNVQEKGSPIEVQISNQNFDVSNLDSSPPIVLTLRQNGELLSQEKWNSISLADISAMVNNDDSWPWEVKKGSTISTFDLYPALIKGDPFTTPTGELPLTLSVKMVYEEQTSLGDYSGTITINDDISQLDRILNWIERNGLKALLAIILLITLLGYVPGIKKYLPSRWKKRGHTYKVLGVPKRRGEDFTQKWKVKIDLATSLIPYRAEKGSIQISVPQDPPRGMPAKLNVKAGEGGFVYITNIKSFPIRDSFKIEDNIIDSSRIKKNGYRVRKNFSIRYETDTHYYDVNPYTKAQ